MTRSLAIKSTNEIIKADTITYVLYIVACMCMYMNFAWLYNVNFEKYFYKKIFFQNQLYFCLFENL